MCVCFKGILVVWTGMLSVGEQYWVMLSAGSVTSTACTTSAWRRWGSEVVAAWRRWWCGERGYRAGSAPGGNGTVTVHCPRGMREQWQWQRQEEWQHQGAGRLAAASCGVPFGRAGVGFVREGYWGGRERGSRGSSKVVLWVGG